MFRMRRLIAPIAIPRHTILLLHHRPRHIQRPLPGQFDDHNTRQRLTRIATACQRRKLGPDLDRGRDDVCRMFGSGFDGTSMFDGIVFGGVVGSFYGLSAFAGGGCVPPGVECWGVSLAHTGEGGEFWDRESGASECVSRGVRTV